MEIRIPPMKDVDDSIMDIFAESEKWDINDCNQYIDKLYDLVKGDNEITIYEDRIRFNIPLYILIRAYKGYLMKIINNNEETNDLSDDKIKYLNMAYNYLIRLEDISRQKALRDSYLIELKTFEENLENNEDIKF